MRQVSPTLPFSIQSDFNYSFIRRFRSICGFRINKLKSTSRNKQISIGPIFSIIPQKRRIFCLNMLITKAPLCNLALFVSFSVLIAQTLSCFNFQIKCEIKNEKRVFRVSHAEIPCGLWNTETSKCDALKCQMNERTRWEHALCVEEKNILIYCVSSAHYTHLNWT